MKQCRLVATYQDSGVKAMPRSGKSAKTDAVADPNTLVRQQAGTYRTPDERFEAQESGTGWFLVDSAQTNEFGQAVVLGPFPTLKAVRDALPEARRTALKSRAPQRSSGARSAAKAQPRTPPPAPPLSWIDQLPKADAAAVRALIRALEREGAADAERLVRRDRDGRRPEVVAWLIGRRLTAIGDDLPESEREAAGRLIQRVVEVLTVEGRRLPHPLPGWSLVEIGPKPEPSNRRVTID